MRSGTTPGKWVVKRSSRAVDGLDDEDEDDDVGGFCCCWSWVNSAVGAKSVQVKERLREGMAMNMQEGAGQMWRWWGEMRKVGEIVGGEGGEGGMVNSHHSVSM